MKHELIRPENESQQIAGYQGAEQTIEVRKTTIQNVVAAHRELFHRSNPQKLSLYDPAAVNKAIDEYLSFCSSHFILPSMSGFAASANLSRVWVYSFMNDHPDEPAAQLLKRFRSLMDACRISATDQKAVP
jgi:hypothetical protein